MAAFVSSIIDLASPGSPTWGGSTDLSPFGIYGDVTEALLPVAMVCAVSLLGTAAWLLAVGAHLRSGVSHGA
jgi:hypothetical protein